MPLRPSRSARSARPSWPAKVTCAPSPRRRAGPAARPRSGPSPAIVSRRPGCRGASAAMASSRNRHALARDQPAGEHERRGCRHWRRAGNVGVDAVGQDADRQSGAVRCAMARRLRLTANTPAAVAPDPPRETAAAAAAPAAAGADCSRARPSRAARPGRAAGHAATSRPARRETRTSSGTDRMAPRAATLARGAPTRPSSAAARPAARWFRSRLPTGSRWMVAGALPEHLDLTAEPARDHVDAQVRPPGQHAQDLRAGDPGSATHGRQSRSTAPAGAAAGRAGRRSCPGPLRRRAPCRPRRHGVRQQPPARLPRLPGRRSTPFTSATGRGGRAKRASCHGPLPCRSSMIESSGRIRVVRPITKVGAGRSRPGTHHNCETRSAEKPIATRGTEVPRTRPVRPPSAAPRPAAACARSPRTRHGGHGSPPCAP